MLLLPNKDKVRHLDIFFLEIYFNHCLFHKDVLTPGLRLKLWHLQTPEHSLSEIRPFWRCTFQAYSSFWIRNQQVFLLAYIYLRINTSCIQNRFQSSSNNYSFKTFLPALSSWYGRLTEPFLTRYCTMASSHAFRHVSSTLPHVTDKHVSFWALWDQRAQR